jgi:hypothetical protein
MNACQKYFSACLLALLTQAAFAQAPTLGAAASFAVLGGAGVTCTASTITGNVGSLLTVTPTPTCSIVGSIVTGAAALQAFKDFDTAYSGLAGIPCPADAPHNLSGDLGGKTLSPGVYCISGVGLLTSQLTLAGTGSANDVWIFKAASSLTPIGGSVVMSGGGQACNVFWQTGTAVSLDATHFLGNILAGSAVTFTGVGSSLIGRALAHTAVTATGSNINGDCTTPAPGPGPGACSDRVTGGGYIETGHGKANFGVTAGIRKGAPRGHLTYIDHGKGLKVKGTGVTAYVVVDAKTRHIEGTAKINGVAGTYKVDVTDNGEPGKNHDVFAITLSNGYTASGKLAGGNIQLHKQHCDKNGHDRDDDDHEDDDDGDHGDHSKKRD